MRAGGRQRSSRRAPPGELTELRARLLEAKETLRVIQSGGVDALVVAGKHGPRVYTLEGADHAYRVLIESMSEGALTLTAGAVILYANQRFAKMLKRPLERIMGSPFQRLVSAEDRAALRALLKRRGTSDSRLQVSLQVSDGTRKPAQISIRPLSQNGSRGARLGMVVTDMTETVRSQEMLRVLSHRLVQAQESERGRVAFELTDNITQSLVVILFRLQKLVDKMPADAWPSRGEVVMLSEQLSGIAQEVELLSRSLRPSVLRNLGLVAAMRASSEEWEQRTGVPVKLALTKLNPLPPPEIKLALYRIFEEALRNVEKHARARLVTVRLTQQGAFAQLAIKDDGIGFDPDHLRAKRKGADGLGLPRMRERAGFMGAALTIKSAPHAGTEVKVRISLPQERPGAEPKKTAIRARASELPHPLPRAMRRPPGQRKRTGSHAGGIE